MHIIHDVSDNIHKTLCINYTFRVYTVHVIYNIHVRKIYTCACAYTRVSMYMYLNMCQMKLNIVGKLEQDVHVHVYYIHVCIYMYI